MAFARSMLHRFGARTATNIFCRSGLHQWYLRQAPCRTFAKSSEPEGDLYKSPMVPYDHEDETAPLHERAWTLQPPSQKGTLVWLHEVAQPDKATSTIFTMITPDSMRVIAPFANKVPVSALNEDLERAWFDVYDDQSLDAADDESGIHESCVKIHALLDRECDMIDSKKIIVGGFGHGGAMALYAALSYAKPLGGAISFSGYLPLRDQAATFISEANKKLPILAYHAKTDRIVKFANADVSYQHLRKLGVPVELRLMQDGRHVLTPEGLLQLQTWWVARVEASSKS